MTPTLAERRATGLEQLARIEGHRAPSILDSLKDIAPDLAELMIGFVYGEIYPRGALDLRQRQLVTVGALAALGHARPQLEFHLAGALHAGCTPDEIVEAMIHMTVFAGFPAAVNGVFAAQAVLRAQGIEWTPPAPAANAPGHSRFDAGWQALKAIDGHAGERVIDSLRDIAPDLGRYVVEFSFGDIYTRPALDLLARELVTIGALTALGSAGPQLQVHIHGALNVGGKREQVVEAIIHTAAYAGFPAAINAASLAKAVFAARDAH